MTHKITLFFFLFCLSYSCSKDSSKEGHAPEDVVNSESPTAEILTEDPNSENLKPTIKDETLDDIPEIESDESDGSENSDESRGHESNGGNFAVGEFLALSRKIVFNLELFPEWDILATDEIIALKESLDTVEIEVRFGPLRDNQDNLVNAKVESGRIVLEENFWTTAFLSKLDLKRLVFHELLRLIKVPDDKFEVSSKLDYVQLYATIQNLGDNLNFDLGGKEYFHATWTGSYHKDDYLTEFASDCVDGSHCAIISVNSENAPSTFGTVIQCLTLNNQEGTLRLTGSIKTKDINGPGIGVGASLWMRVDYSKEHSVLDNMGLSRFSGTNDWQQQEIKITFEKGAVNVCFGGMLLGASSGSAWFDDFELSLLTSTPHKG